MTCWSSSITICDERGFKWLWTIHGCWCQTGLSEYLTNCWSTGIFMHNHLQELQRWSKKKKSVSGSCVAKMPCWSRGSEENEQTVGNDRRATGGDWAGHQCANWSAKLKQHNSTTIPSDFYFQYTMYFHFRSMLKRNKKFNCFMVSLYCTSILDSL